MLKLKDLLSRLRRSCLMTPEQSDQIARIKFPCC